MLGPRSTSPWMRKRFGGWTSRNSSVRIQSCVEQETGAIITVGRLVEARRTALRHGVWFRALDRTERGILNLTMRCVDRIRSTRLAKIVTAILIKLKLAMESVVERMVRVIGRSLAQKVSNIALSWGNRSASQWVEDPGFARYLAITQMNTPRLFQV